LSARPHPDEVGRHRNTEGELVTLRRLVGGKFAGQLVLTVVDDGPIATEAPTLLDAGTLDWLRRELFDADEPE
jgi:hypothetical protein